jgi:hypothetical protein
MHAIIVEKEPPSLPNWDGWGSLFTDGLKVFGISFIYSLPFLVLFFGGFGLFFATTMFAEIGSGDPNAPPSLTGLFPLTLMSNSV